MSQVPRRVDDAPGVTPSNPIGPLASPETPAKPRTRSKQSPTTSSNAAHAADRHAADDAQPINRADTTEADMAKSEPVKRTDGASEVPFSFTDAASPAAMAPAPEYPSEAQLDEDEAMLRALRIDLPGTAGAPSGIIAITCTDKLPKKEFIRSSRDVIAMNLVDHAAGMETELHAVTPNMLAPLLAIDIYPAPYKLFQVLTADGGFRIIAIKQANADGQQNEWTRTKETALIHAQKGWVRSVSDRENGRYRVFPAPTGRFPEPPIFPQLTWGQIVRLAFTDRGRLIDSPQHPLFMKWAGRDGGDI
jgi:hypothetical protein